MKILLQIWFHHMVMLGGCAARLGPSNLIMFRKLARVQVSARYHWWRLNFQCCYSMREAAFEHGSTFGNLKRSGLYSKSLYISHAESFFFMKQNLWFGLVLGQPALLKFFSILLKYPTFKVVITKVPYFF